ncbi:hypothetical protein GWI33_019711 [Rhynchophorus ferrugineus]|uniref:F-box domain-containing protein n=1 Tax=Rhynchophorus ferrugineus TaxID=354439 RepID=A0A834HQV3_RHYFE|nr:hypothetical protein GWI33_019711 [Rhynchophorus ferrugineus]
MYKFFSSVAAIPQLPMELWCYILRMLDLDTLLAIWRSSSYIDYIIRGDSILRQKIEEALKQESHRNFQVLTEPRSAIQITRERPNVIFGWNCGNICIKKSRGVVKQSEPAKRTTLRGAIIYRNALFPIEYKFRCEYDLINRYISTLSSA